MTNYRQFTPLPDPQRDAPGAPPLAEHFRARAPTRVNRTTAAWVMMRLYAAMYCHAAWPERKDEWFRGW